MVRPSWKQVLGVLFFVGLLGVVLLAASFYIQKLPADEQPSTWRWFRIGWAVSTVGCSLFFLPYWLRNTLVTGKPEEVRKWESRYRFIPGICVVAFTLGGVTYPADLPFRLALGSIVCGLDIALIIFLTALFTTKKGQAMIEKAAAERNQRHRGRSRSR